MQIISEAKEPHKTFYWLAAETGMRAGELCALRWEDIDLDQGIVHVRQSAWRDVIQTPKSVAGYRVFAISTTLSRHLRDLKGMSSGLVFVNKSGRIWKGGKVVAKHLRPLLDRLGIPRKGLYAFRHLNGSLMDQFGAPLKVRSVWGTAPPPSRSNVTLTRWVKITAALQLS